MYSIARERKREERRERKHRERRKEERKKLALIDNNMICQIVTDGTLRKKNLQSIATKVLLQIIAKRGNTLWVPKSKSSS